MSDTLVTILMIVGFVGVSVVATYMRQQDRKAGRERPLNLIAAALIVILAVAIILLV